jgi:hypothetical protein
MLRTPVARAAALVVALSPTVARAESGGVALRIDCPTLGADAQSALETRAHAELLSESLPRGEVVVACEGTSAATVSWTPEGGTKREQRVQLSSGPEALDDTVLASLHGLLFAEERPSTAPPPQPAPSAEPSPPASEAPASERSPPSIVPGGVRVAGLVGGDAELWQGGVNVALGASAGASISLRQRWAVRATVGPQWGLGSADGIRAWGLRGLVEVDYAVLPRLPVGLGASARSLWADASRAAPTQLAGTTGGVVLSARYVVSFGLVTFAVGLKGEALVRPIVVELGSVEAFRVPAFVAGLTLDGTAP